MMNTQQTYLLSQTSFFVYIFGAQNVFFHTALLEQLKPVPGPLWVRCSHNHIRQNAVYGVKNENSRSAQDVFITHPIILARDTWLHSLPSIFPPECSYLMNYSSGTVCENTCLVFCGKHDLELYNPHTMTSIYTCIKAQVCVSKISQMYIWLKPTNHLQRRLLIFL